MSTLNAAIVALALFSASCGASASGPPEIVVDRTVCSHCSMLVSELIYAAAYQADGKEPRVFDDIGCLLESLRRETEVPGRIWFQDAAGGGWLGATAAVFVDAPQIRTPMGGGLLAYQDIAGARRTAKAVGGQVVPSWPELVIRRGEGR